LRISLPNDALGAPEGFFMAETIARRASSISATDRIEGTRRSVEDYLDWVENHQHVTRGSGRLRATLIGIAFTLTALTAAAMAFVGF